MAENKGRATKQKKSAGSVVGFRVDPSGENGIACAITGGTRYRAARFRKKKRSITKE